MLHEYECDAIIANIDTPPLRLPPPRVRLVVKKKSSLFIPPKFIMLTDEFYKRWISHQKRMHATKPEVDNKPLKLMTETVLNHRKITNAANILQDMLTHNKALVQKICLIQHDKGRVKCWQDMSHKRDVYKRVFNRRAKEYAGLEDKNRKIFKNFQKAHSDMATTKELEKQWKKTKQCVIAGATLPIVLFQTHRIDKGMKDPAFEKPEGVYRKRVSMDIWIEGGAKIGKIYIELFNDIVPESCKLFMKLVKGDEEGYAYTRTRFFRIVQGLYCRGGDVEKNNGFGSYKTPGGKAYKPENFLLNHSMPGVVSLPTNPSGELCGHFNITFKPLPQFDGKNVVIGRIVSGPAETLTRISSQGLSLGRTRLDVVIRECGRYTKMGYYRKGAINIRPFPPRRIHS